MPDIMVVLACLIQCVPPTPLRQLGRVIEALHGRVERTSQTSSKPPSSDSPFNKPKRQRRPSKGGKRGARTGHRGTGPPLLTPTEAH